MGVNSARLILKTGQKMGDCHQDKDCVCLLGASSTNLSFTPCRSEGSLPGWLILLMTLLGAHKIQVPSSACHSHNLHNSARTKSLTTSELCQRTPNSANKAQAPYFTDLTLFYFITTFTNFIQLHPDYHLAVPITTHNFITSRLTLHKPSIT
jgi:hypothetical protein